ncbi:MAG TPA: pyruvate formate lyase family protein, partial [Armatimonadota bacterium]
GRLTQAEAQDLLWAFLAITDAKFGVDKPYETSTCVVIGGCDAQGTVVFNEVTRMIIGGYQALRLVNPKLNARISAAHPEEYFTALADLAASGANVLAILNDDVIIPANVRAGKALADARLYVAGGCQETVLQNTEINSRATMYLNLLQVLHMGFAPQAWTWFTEREGIGLIPLAQRLTFEDFYEGYLANLHAVMHAHIAFRNTGERESWRMNPCPLLSSTLSDCLENARDMLEGGTRYSAGSVSLIGVGTLIDALYAVKALVFTQGMLTLPELVAMLARNYDGDEIVRQYSIHRLPKFGQEDAGIREFSARVFADLARLSDGEVNARGGRYEASVFVYRFFKTFGVKTSATPDGRKAGEWLAQGMSPSYLGLGEQNSIAHLLEALEPLDLTQYPVTAVLDMKLPLMRGGQGQTVVSILQRFLGVGGSTLQLNVVDSATLLDARQHPERYPDLVVRVSGYSARFVVLPEDIQEELIARTVLG